MPLFEELTALDNAIQGTTDPEVFLRDLKDVVRAHYAKAMPALDSAALDGVSAVSMQRLEQYLAEAIMVKHAPMVASELISIGAGGVQPWTQDFKYRVVEDIGLASWISDSDMPWADVSETEESRKVYEMGAKVGWTISELEAARQGNVPLDTSKLRAQRVAVERARNEVMLRGDGNLKKSGLVSTGFINDASVTITSAPGGIFSARTGQQLVDDFLSLWATYKSATKRTYLPNAVALPTAQFHLLLKPFGSGSNMSIRQYLLENIPGLEKIIEIEELNNAGASSADRMVVYNDSSEVVEGVLPLSFQLMDPQLMGMRTVVHAFERNAGVVVKFPPAVLYVDGI